MRKINTRSFVRATRATPREINRQIVLNLVHEHQPISRADLARRMDIGRGMVTSLVDELLSEGSIYEGDTIDAPRGRRPKMLYVRTHDRLVVAIDVRFSQTFVMLSDFAGTAIALETFETVVVPAALVQQLASRITRLLDTHGGTGRCEGIGLVVPGMVDQHSGRVLNAPQLGWKDVDVRDALARATGLPVHIENAPIACALAHMWLGQRGGPVPGDFAYVTVSDGVGVGFVVNGEVVRGHTNTAGEFGHIPLDLKGPTCLCGARGCLEAHTSNLATLARYLGQQLSSATMRPLLQSTRLSITDVIAHARSGDARAIAALDETARYLGIGLSIVINALNPSEIFVGGEIADVWDQLLPTIRAAIADRALTSTAAATPIIPEAASSYPRLRGAIALVAAPLFAAPRVA
ncbi:MAG TPA: ROK family transcriptional regulator [Gemmatimonadaceae bacterium]|nr:ROK family transcriptional regulator [Gemmatimonadaceae bacterium]